MRPHFRELEPAGRVVATGGGAAASGVSLSRRCRYHIWYYCLDAVERRDAERDGRWRTGRAAAGHAGATRADRRTDRGRRLPNVKEPHVRHIRGPLWEIRLKGKTGIARALYVTAGEQRVVILRAFVKKTGKTPRREIDVALERAREVQP